MITTDTCWWWHLHGVIFLAKYWAMGEEEHNAVVAGGAGGRLILIIVRWFRMQPCMQFAMRMLASWKNVLFCVHIVKTLLVSSNVHTWLGGMMQLTQYRMFMSNMWRYSLRRCTSYLVEPPVLFMCSTFSVIGVASYLSYWYNDSSY